jgi:ribosomal protein S18 acetylase RimI-like enzyme
MSARQHESEKSKMVSIRRMTPTDIEVVIQLDMLAFAAHLRQTGYNGPVHPRTHENVLACLNLSQTGCFVAEADKLIGYIFTHIWGTTGWIGTFGVHPDCQGQGIGQSLLGAAVEHLQGAGCMTIGLETMSDSPYNVGFYSRFGFLPTFPTVLLVKETGALSTASPYTMLGQPEIEEALAAITMISQAACPGLDYAPEASNAREYEWGEALLIGWPQSWAFVVVRTTPKREGAAETVADVEALVIHPEAGRSLEKALQTVETFAHNQGLEHVNLAVNAADGEALQQALGYGFRVRDVMLRMVFNGEYAHPVGKVLSKWLM